jgi:predicted permease
VAQAGAILYPGTAAFDHEFITPMSYILGLPLQTYAEFVSLVFTGIAAWLALKPNAKWTD